MLIPSPGVALLFGLVVGGLLAWVLTRAAGARRVAEARGAQAAQVGAAEARLDEAAAWSADLSDRLRAREREIERLHGHLSAVSAEKARLEGELAAAADRNALLKTA
jgi:predicted nuclease with TOPRIM domain